MNSKLLLLFSLLTASQAAVLSTKRAPQGFVTANQAGGFELDGNPFKFISTNPYWLQKLNGPNDAKLQARQSNGTDTTNDMTSTLVSMKGRGVKVVRAWGFNELESDGSAKSKRAEENEVFFQRWVNGVPTINLGPNGLQKLDQMVDEAERTGLYLQFSLTNNWVGVHDTRTPRIRGFSSNDYGGMDTYVRQIVGPHGTHDEFYTNPKVIAAFKYYVKCIVERYKDRKGIFSWELANDPRCQATGGNNQGSKNCNTKTITKWVAELSKFIKDIDPHHLVTSGAGGFFCVDCPKTFATSRKRSFDTRSDLPEWQRIKGDGPWTRAALIAKRMSEGLDIRQATALGPAFDGSTGVDTDDINSIPSVDFGSFQFFPDQGTYSQTADPENDGTDRALGFNGQVQRGLEWISLHAAAAKAPTKPTSFNGFGLVGQDSSQAFVPFNSSTGTGVDTQQPFASTTQQATAYKTWMGASINQSINGISQYSWGQSGLSTVFHPTSGATKRNNNRSPDDGYAAFTDDVQSELTNAATLQAQSG